MPAMMVPSAAMRRLRREGIEISRRRAALAQTGGVVGKAKTPSPPPQYVVVLALPAPAPRSNPAPATTCIPPAPRRAGGGGGALPERARPTPSSATGPRSSDDAAPAKPVEAIKQITGKGAQVRVRTRVATARTGQPIVFWLRAVVDSADDEDGFVHVTYDYVVNGKLPRTARVAPSDVRLHHDVPPTAAAGRAAASAVSTDRPARLPQKNKAAPRPTVAGKRLPLLKKFEEEMKSRSKAVIGAAGSCSVAT